MNIIRKELNEIGACSNVQTWSKPVPPEGCAIVPDTLDMTEFYAYNGFVTLIIEDDTVTAYTPNVEAWEAWKASLPEPTEEEPSQIDRIEAQVTYTAMMTDTLLEG